MTEDDALDRLIQEVMAAPAPPCERNGRCPHFDRCRDEGLACVEFYLYCRLKKHQDNHLGLATPDRARFELIYKATDVTGHGGPRTGLSSSSGSGAAGCRQPLRPGVGHGRRGSSP